MKYAKCPSGNHSCNDGGKNRLGRYSIRRIKIAKRQRRKLREIRRELKRRFNRPVSETGRWLRQVLQGHSQYFAVPNNLSSMK